jgi:ubiquinone/menaquinone biosynthesis C-methylase UbiE
MKLNVFETLLMNNPVRELVQRRYEAPRLARLAKAPTAGSPTLVIGCGRGVDVELAFERFGAARVVAFDIDPAQVERARRRLAGRYERRLALEVGDAAAMGFADGSFGLVLDFGIIHHVPQWQAAVREVSRVLWPGGQFLFEEIPGAKLARPHYRWLTDHPRANRFDADDFARECESAGLRLEGRLETFFGFFRGAAVKPEEAA